LVINIWSIHDARSEKHQIRRTVMNRVEYSLTYRFSRTSFFKRPSILRLTVEVSCLSYCCNTVIKVSILALFRVSSFYFTYWLVSILRFSCVL